jgi:hypothetical protein
MTHRKQIKRLEELMETIRDVQIEMAGDGLAIENYESIIGNFQKRYHALTKHYYHSRKVRNEKAR